MICIVKPSFPAEELYVSPNVEAARLVPFDQSIGSYLCTGEIPRAFLSRGVKIAVRYSGTNVKYWPADLNIYELNGVVVVRIAYVVPDTNELFVVYTAKGIGYVSIDEEIPKDVAQTYMSVHGGVVFLNPDPVLRMYLRAENGKIDIRHYQVDDASEIPAADVSIRFASCSLSVADFSARRTKLEGKDYLTGRFRILGDDGKPVLIPNLTVRVGNQSLSPQHSSTDMYYSFFAPYADNIRSVVISADVPGCSHFEQTIPVQMQQGLDPVILLLFVLAVLAVAFAYLYVKKKRE